MKYVPCTKQEPYQCNIQLNKNRPRNAEKQKKKVHVPFKHVKTLFLYDNVTQNKTQLFYSIDCINSPVAIFKLYTAKLNPTTDFLWQKPLSKQLNYTDECWFEPRRVSHNPLESYMKILCEEANLVEKIYTNHSIRATCILKLDHAGFEARHITALSGHKSESKVKEYAIHCPETKRREMFNGPTSN